MPWFPALHYDDRRGYYARIARKVHYLGKHKPTARSEYRKLLSEHGYLDTVDEPECLADVIEQWLADRPSRPYDWYMRPFIAYAGRLALTAIEPDCLARYAAYLRNTDYIRRSKKRTSDGLKWVETRHRYKPWTIRKYVLCARSVLAFAQAQGWLTSTPQVGKLTRAVNNPRHATTRQLTVAFATLPKTAKPILHFILATGCRPGEACQLEWHQVDLDAGVCILADHKTAAATGEVRTIYLTPEALDTLTALPHREGPVFLHRYGRPYTTGGLRSIMRRRGLTTYQLRHAFAQNALDHGTDLYPLARLLGHRTLRMVQNYARVREPQARQAAQNLVSQVAAPPVRHIAAADSGSTDAAQREDQESPPPNPGKSADATTYQRSRDCPAA